MNTRIGRTKEYKLSTLGLRTFDKLTAEEQEKAVDKAIERLLTAIVEGAIRFSDELNHDDLQARIDKAQEHAEKMRTPWFAHEYIMDTCRDDIEGMARCDAENAVYSDGSTQVVTL